MQNDVNKRNTEPEAEITGQFSEFVAKYFEQKNNGASPAELANLMQSANTDEELRRVVGLIKLTEKAAQDKTDIDKAWQSFRARTFKAAPATAKVNLGNYVSETLASGEAVKVSGLPRETLEALRQDNTPLTELKDFELADYAALAKRYGVKDTLFPRMLKWLKGLGKSFAAPTTFGPSRPTLRFAREEGFEYQATEQTLADELERAEDEGKRKEE